MSPPPTPPITIVRAMEAVLQPYSACSSGVIAPSTGLKKETAAKEESDAAAAIHQPAKMRLKGARRSSCGRSARRSCDGWLGRLMGARVPYHQPDSPHR